MGRRSHRAGRLMKIWLDDERPFPDESWTWVFTAQQAIDFLKTGEVKEISLDHDLGDEESCGNGYQVICFIEEQVITNESFSVPVIHIHTANPVARKKMQQCLDGIRGFRNE